MSRYKSIRLSKWFGRFGNNINQMINVIQIALEYQLNVSMIKHPFFDTSKLCLKFHDESGPTLTNSDGFFYRHKIKHVNKSVFTKWFAEAQQLLKDAFIIQDVEPRPTNDLVIHIRSGDIFCTTNPHRDYVMPPLSYYTSIIENNSFDNIIVVAENLNNPTVHGLLRAHPEIKWKKQSLTEDMKLILSATNLVESFGTFTPGLIVLSDNIRNVWKPSFQWEGFLIYRFPKRFREHLNITTLNLRAYHKSIWPWQNTRQQRSFMLKYKPKDDYERSVIRETMLDP